MTYLYYDESILEFLSLAKTLYFSFFSRDILPTIIQKNNNKYYLDNIIVSIFQKSQSANWLKVMIFICSRK